MDTPKGKASVHYRLPGETQIHVIGPGTELIWDGKMDEHPQFLFAPFNLHQPPILTIGMDEAGPSIPPIEAPQFFSEKEDFIALVEKAQSTIREGKADKIVTARVKKHASFPKPLEQFHHLCQQHPNAFCYLWQSDSAGTWLGATPELFLESRGKSIKTVALAGTKIKERFGDKEQVEQGFVKNYIVETLKSFATQIEVKEQHLVSSGHLSHLRNEIHAELVKPEDLLSLITQLHPTPAVGGLPKAEALEFISRNEGMDRSYYSGYLGLISQDRSDLYVNLRCLQVIDDVAYTYAGAGIVAGSNPESEWLETEEKMKVVLSTLSS